MFEKHRPIARDWENKARKQSYRAMLSIFYCLWSKPSNHCSASFTLFTSFQWPLRHSRWYFARTVPETTTDRREPVRLPSDSIATQLHRRVHPQWGKLHAFPHLFDRKEVRALACWARGIVLLEGRSSGKLSLICINGPGFLGVPMSVSGTTDKHTPPISPNGSPHPHLDGMGVDSSVNTPNGHPSIHIYVSRGTIENYLVIPSRYWQVIRFLRNKLLF
jgi:hypothetical protein